MNCEQTTIFDFIYPKYKITKPIRLIELFSGYGSQALALKYLEIEFEHWKTCEWAIKSIQAYKDIHFPDDTKEISMSKEEMIDYLYSKGISNNYNEPMTKSQISRLSEKRLKTIIENIEIAHNLVNIQQAKGIDFDITDKEHYEYIMTYSFPCTDLSLAGKRKGMADTSTRSGAYAAGMILVKNATKKGYLEATDGDGINLSNRMEHQRGNDRGVVISNNLKKDLCNKLIKENKVKENDVIRHSYSNSRLNNWKERGVETNNISPTLDTRCDCLGFCVGTYQYSKSDKFMNGKDRLQIGKEVSDTLQTTPKEAICYNDLRIRKLTPRETGRLMGVKDEDIDKLLKNQSDSSAFHLFGDSIIVNILMAIFGELLDVSWIEKFKKIEDKFIDK